MENRKFCRTGLAERNRPDRVTGAGEAGPLPDETLTKLKPLYATDFGHLA
ncbi:MAG: hypothetical protein WD767_07580 [Alphaproteobacteria bacterium]